LHREQCNKVQGTKALVHDGEGSL